MWSADPSIGKVENSFRRNHPSIATQISLFFLYIVTGDKLFKFVNHKFKLNMFELCYVLTGTTRKQAKGPGQRYQLLLQPVLMPRISTGCKSSWYLWPAAIKGKVFGTGLKHHPVPKLKYRKRLVPPTGTKSTRRNMYRLVEPTGA